MTKIYAVNDGDYYLPPAIDAGHLARQRAFSITTFGPGLRTKGVLDHIRKELVEIEESPTDLGEWVDVVILALDGAWRAGHGPQEIIDAIIAKQAKNEARTWPDYRSFSSDEAIEHVRETPVDRAGAYLGGFVSGQESNPSESIQHLGQDETEIHAPRNCHCGGPDDWKPHPYGQGYYCRRSIATSRSPQKGALDALAEGTPVTATNHRCPRCGSFWGETRFAVGDEQMLCGHEWHQPSEEPHSDTGLRIWE